MTQPKRPIPQRSTPIPVGPGRRVVTGVDAQGKSVIVMDGPVPDNASFHSPENEKAHAVWRVLPGQYDLSDETDPMESFSLEDDWFPPPGGMGAIIITWEPGYEFPMHATETLDVLFILSGQIELILENGSTVLSPGECVVQRGTAHSWRVVGDQPFTGVGFLVGTVKCSQEAP
jgi:mannose-6-phosphate isomerase-like protein (cupin superfamily)